MESLEPHPATAVATHSAAVHITVADFTVGTVPKRIAAIGQAARRVGQLTGTRLID